MRVELLTSRFESAWEKYVMEHPAANLYHRLPWRDVIVRATRHRSHYLVALKDNGIVGVLPLFIIRSRLFGNMGVSMPFLNYGGILANDAQAQEALLSEARVLAKRQALDYIELRHLNALSFPELLTSERKITASLSLAGGAEEVFTGRLHQNVRNKIRKAKKRDVSVRKGPNLLDEFYRVYAHNLRDLGTPVMGKRFFSETMQAFGSDAQVYVAVRAGYSIGAKLVITFHDTMYFIWAGALRPELVNAPVHAANWAAIKDACAQGLAFVDFGRSTAESSHHKFKKYWGVEAHPYSWQYILNRSEKLPELNPDNPKFNLVVRAWKRMPVFLTRLIGPALARNLP